MIPAMAVIVRSATPEDLNTVVSRRIEFLGEVRTPAFQPSDELIEKTRSFVAVEQSAGRLHTWIAEDGPEFVGIVSVLLWPRPPQPEDTRTTEAYVINMYVPAAHRRRGIGQQLLQACLESSTKFGIRKYLLHSTDQARRFYESNGFAPNTDWMELPVRH